MAIVELSTGRAVDNSCPFSGECWANQGCYPRDGCPPTLLDVLRQSAELEHALGMTPHTDPDLAEVCPRSECRSSKKG